MNIHILLLFDRTKYPAKKQVKASDIRRVPYLINMLDLLL